MSILQKILPQHKWKREWASIAYTLVLATPLALWGIYGIEEYGIALFLLIPLLVGLASTIFYGYNRKISLKGAIYISSLTLGVIALGFLIFAIEGLICIVMAAPIALILGWTGALIGFAIINKAPSRSVSSIIILLIMIPTTAFIEKDNQPKTHAVVTKVIINTSPKTVWRNVIEFPQLHEPRELLFKVGIAYPINARIEGQGVGAVRHCNFNTGSFVEPITVWDEPRLLAFDVVEQPEPMRELCFWDIDAPHLHDYFVSQRGQFKLTELPDGRTELEGTTWYYHDIKPELYWRMWSDWIIHNIHNRVLDHIKLNSENEGQIQD